MEIWVKINLGFLRKPLQFSIHHSSFIIHHFLYLHFSYNSFVLHFFKPLNSYESLSFPELLSRYKICRNGDTSFPEDANRGVQFRGGYNS